jgi:hypothetical protein
LRFRRLLSFALFASATGVTMCTPFREDPSDASPAEPGPSRDGADSPPLRGADAQAGPACDLGKPFGAPTLVSGLAALANWVAGLRLSPDYLTGYFFLDGRADSIGNSDLYTAARRTPTSPFGPVAPMGGPGINTSAFEIDPTVSGDGLMLIFGRNALPNEVTHLYYATRTTTETSFAYLGLVPNVNDFAATELSPFLREDGQVLYFASTRSPAGDYDIYRAAWNGSSFDTPVPVSELNTSFRDTNPVVTPDDLTIYFNSTRPDGNSQGFADTWTATRASTSDPFSAPTNVVELNLPHQFTPTFVTRDGCSLYFQLNDFTTPEGFFAAYVAEKPAR